MKKQNYRISIIGPQSSGKGTQADLLSEKLKLPLISVGNLIREQIKRKTKIGKKAEKFVKEGSLIPDELTNQLVNNKIKSIKSGFIIDGYPRNIKQAKFLAKSTIITQVIEITLSDKEAIRRISDRRSCVCGEVYHLKYRPPKKKGICDECGRKLFIREDDQPAAIKRRLKIYRQEIRRLEKFYKKQKVLIKIDGRPKIKEIHREIVKKINVNHKKSRGN